VCLFTVGTTSAPAREDALQAANSPPSAPSNLTVGDRNAPLAVQGTPQFGWLPQDPDGNETQTAYEILVTRPLDGAVVWDSGKVVSSDESYVAYGGPALAPATVYRWTVRTWDRYDEVSPYAAPARFGMGIGDTDWAGAQWIRRVTSGNDSTVDYTLARKELTPSGSSPVVGARVYLSAEREYELHLNGATVYRGDSFDYPGEGQYSATDITRYVTAGAPFALGVIYHYWTCSCQGAAPGPSNGPSGMLARVVVDHADGTSESFVSNGTWRVRRAAQWSNTTPTYRNSDAGDRVEFYDARDESAAWDTVGYDDTGSPWTNAVAIGTHPLASGSFSHLDGKLDDLAYETVHPVSLATLSDGTVVADFGKVIPARPSIHLRNGVAGRVLTMTTSYRRNNTTLAAAASAGDTNLKVASVAGFVVGDSITVDAPAAGYGAGNPERRTITAVGTAAAVGTGITLDAPLSAAHASGAWVEGSRAGTSGLDTQGSNMRWSYTERNGDQTAQTFTYWAWRYLEISAPGEPLTVDDVSAIVQHTDAPGQATFASDDSTLNAVFALLQRSGIYASQETHVDTPTREKGQFLGDTVDISYANMSSFGERSATQRAIREFVYSQARYWPDGRLNAVYPNGDGKRDIPDYTEMFPIWVMRYYLESGDRSLVGRAYPTMKNVAEYIWSYRSSASGLIENLAGGSGQYQYGIIDWPAPMRYGYDMNTSARTVVNAWAVGAFRAVAQAAQALGNQSDADTYAQRADALVAAMNSGQFALRRSDGVYVDGLAGAGGTPGLLPSTHASQHASSFAMYFGIAPSSDYASLGGYITSLGMNQGPMTWHVLLQALALADRPDQIVKLLTDPTSDGPAKILAQGGTFAWEQWDPGCTTSPCAGVAVSQSSSDSFSHGWGSWGVVDILETLLGVRVTGPGAATIAIVPPRVGLQHAHGTVWTERGEVTASWLRQSDGIALDLVIPDNVRARVALPVESSERVFGSGEGAPIFVGLQDGRAVFSVGSGRSHFGPDSTPPVTAASLSPPAVNGWYLNPTVTLTADDGTGSGVESSESRLDGGAWTTYTSPFQVTGDGDHTLDYRSTDNAGNAEQAQTLALKIDATPPTMTISTPVDGGSFKIGSSVAASYACADATSGVDSCTGSVANGRPIDTSAGGSHTFTVLTRDRAGNQRTQTVTYNVIFAFTGFFAPVANPPTLNVVKEGTGIPVKFSLGGNYGLAIFAAGYPQGQSIACGAKALTNNITNTVNVSGSVLTYDKKTNQYTYKWKTDRSWANSCRRLDLKLTDNTVHTALFKFTG
jgi:hypothetical protein